MKKFAAFGVAPVSLCLGLTLAACGGIAIDDDGTDANASVAQAGQVEYLLTAPVESSDPAAAATAVAASPKFPAGCATGVKDPTQPMATITLTNCTGPFGLLRWSGTLSATYSKNADGTLNVKATSTNMTVNGKPAQFSMDRTITVDSATQRTVKGMSTWARQNADGETVTHSNAWTAVVDTTTRCRTVNGAGTTTVGTKSYATSSKDYKICRSADSDSCPSGTLTHTVTPGQAMVSVTFNGTNTAVLSGPNGTRSVVIFCQ
ncbi:MAG: hypothetical protein JNM40_15750 [Myxococcales bacterium]|nr:hypothetical protein [Myxococcales bacterium]